MVTRPKVLGLGPELKKPLKRLAARFFQLSLGREQLDGTRGSCPGRLGSPRNSDMFLRRRPGAWASRGSGQGGLQGFTLRVPLLQILTTVPAGHPRLVIARQTDALSPAPPLQPLKLTLIHRLTLTHMYIHT